MLHVRKPKARTLGSKGFTISTTKDTLDLEHSPVTDASYENPFITRTPGSESSAFELVPASPPRIERKTSRKSKKVDSSIDRKNYKTPTRSSAKKNVSMPCDSTMESSFGSPLGDRQKKAKGNLGKGKGTSNFKDQIKQMRLKLPKAMPKAMKSLKKEKKDAIDLADLAIATICVVPRHGAGIDSGRKPFERMRTSLMLHMIQENQNATVNEDIEGDTKKNGKAQIAKLNASLRNSIADKETCFVEKTQEVVRLAKDTLEELKGDTKSLMKTELGQRNLLAIKFLSGAYRDVIQSEKDTPSRDGLALMLVAGAYYALGKLETALSVYQRAGIELKKKIHTAPEIGAKLFNNMACVYFETNKYEKAMQTYQRALQLFHNDKEEEYNRWCAAILDQACILNNMAYTLIKFKQYEDASDLVDTSFELQQIIPGNASTTMTIATLSSMAFIYYRMKKYKLSLDTYSACVQLQDKSPMHSESDQVQVLRKMTNICKKTKDHEKRIYLLRCILIYQQCFLLEGDDEIMETHAELADAIQAFADNGGSSI